MRISVTGCCYLGAVHAAAMAELGHEVVGVDVDPGKIEALSGARAPFFEPGFEELLARTLGTGRLRFSTDIAAAAGCAVHFVCVGTPQKRRRLWPQLEFADSPEGAAEPADGCRP
jgi:UDPglucose 6-dehydrogenase